MNQSYDLTFLLNEEGELAKIKELIASLKGNLTKEKSWGKKTLCFPIKKTEIAGFYHWQIKIDKKNLSELKKKLNFNDKLIRYLIIRADA